MFINEVSVALSVLCSNLERTCSKSQFFYLNFKTKFHSWAKSNPWVGCKQPTGHMLCSPGLEEGLCLVHHFSPEDGDSMFL
jgi:hypothetical protein